MIKYPFILFAFLISNAFAAEEFTYFGVGPDTYEIKLLKKVLEHARDEPVKLRNFDGYIPKLRAFQIMNKGEGIDVIVGGATKERAALSRPIHFPIFKGLFGMRISLVNKDRIDILKEVNNLEELTSYIAGQFHSWSDTHILRHNGITVASGSDVNGLYLMLHKGRYDFFPRSILEASWNLQEHKDLNLAIDPHTLIQYPKAHYYYVQKGNEVLAQRIKTGLEALLENGEKDKLFDETFGATLRSMELHKRRIIKMENPDLPEGVPTERDELWLKIEPKI
jgi:hypothetical protein